jgi:gliding motility-associated-like protein
MQIPTAAFIPIPPDSTYRLRMVIRNTCGDDSADAVIRIVSPTKPNFSVINNNTCPGEQMNFQNNTNHRAFQSYRVDFGDGTVVNMGYSATFSHTYLVGGTYWVKMYSSVNGYNGQTCGLADSIQVQVKTTVTPIVHANPKLGCDTLTVRIENNSINTAGVVWRGWELGGSPIATAGSGVLPSLVNFMQMQVLNNNLADSSANVRFKMHGRYIIRLRAQSLGCPEISDFDTVEVYPSPTLRWQIPGKIICLGNSITVRDSSRVITTDRRGLRSNYNHISWSLNMGDGTVYNSSSNITTNFNSVQGTDRLTSHTYLNPGTYWVKLTVQSPNRCPKVDSMQVTILPATVPNFTWSRDVCNPGLITFRNTTPGTAQRYEYVIRRGTSFFASEIRLIKDTFSYALPYFPPGDSTFYYVTLRAVSGTSPDTCVSSTAPILIKIPPVKTAAFSASALDGCTPINDVQFVNQSIGIPTDGSHIYNWTFGNGNSFSGENPPLQNFVNNGTGFRRDTVRLRITNGACVYQTFKVITIYPVPNPAIVGPNEVCHNTPVTFSATGNGLGGFLWSFVELDGTTSTQPNPTRTFANTGNLAVQYNIKLTATTVAGCVDTVMKAIIVNPTPTASFTATPEAACGASPVLFDASTSVAASTYTWTFSDGTSGIADTTSPIVSRLFPENISPIDRSYLITLTTKSDKGCPSTPATRTVRIRPTVIAAFVADKDSGCSPVAVNFLNLSTQTDDNYTWYVNELGAPGLGVPNLPNQPNRGFYYTFYNNSYTTVASFVVTLVVRDDNGTPICESTKSDTITVLPKPLAGFVRDQVNPTSLCSPTSMRLIARGSQGATLYNWSFTDGSFPIVQNDSIPFFKVLLNNGTAIQNQAINLIVSNDFGCTDTASQNMNIRPKVTASAVVDNVLGCSPLVSNFTNQSSSSAVSYTWFRNGLPVFFNKDLPQQNFLNNSSSDTAVYRIFLVARGEGDVCTDTSATLTIRVLPKPIVSIGANPANGCSPLNMSLSAGGTTGGATYTWFVKQSTDTVYTQIQVNNSSAPFNYVLTNNGNSAINYNIKLLVIGTSGCLDSAFTDVTVFPDVNPAFTASVLQGCAPLVSNFTITSTAPPGTSYIWLVDSVPQFDPTPLSFFYTFAGKSDSLTSTYQVGLQAVTGSGCSRTVNQIITVFPRPKVNFDIVSMPSGACSPVAARFIPGLVGQLGNLNWIFDSADSLQTTQDTTVYRNYFNPGTSPFTATVRLIMETAAGCKNEISRTLTINPRVVAGFSQSATEGCSPLQVTFTNDGSSAGANVFEWLVEGIPVSNNPTSINYNFTNASFSQTRIYKIQLVARNSFANACFDTATRFVTIYRKPEVSASAFPISGCSPLRTSLTASNSQGGVLYQWYRKLSSQTQFTLDTTTALGTPFDRVLTNNGATMLIYDFKVVVTGADGCKDSAQISITVAPGLKAAFSVSPDTAGCAPFNAVFGNATTSPAANTYAWLVDGINVSNSPAFLTYNFDNTSNTDSKTYEVKLVAANATFGCPDTARRYITVWPKPLVDLAITRDPLSGCSPVVVGFQPVNHLGVQTFTWFLPDTVQTNLDTTVSRIFNNNSVVPSTRFVTLRGTNAFGCFAEKTSNFQVNPRVKAGFTVSRDSVCSPAEIVFTNTSSGGVNAAEWYINDVFKGSSLSSIAELFENNDSLPKQFRIRLVVRNTITPACEDTISKVITILPKPIAGSIFSNPENGCSPLSVSFSGSSVFATRYFWDFGDGSSLDTTSQQVSHTFSNLNAALNAQFTVNQVAINAWGCQDTTFTFITARPNVTAGIIASDSVGCSPLSVSLSGASSINANSYNWNFGDGNTASGVNVNRIFTNNSDTVRTFNIRLIADRAGVSCPDTAFFSLKVNPKPVSEFDANPNAGCQPLAVSFVNNSQLATSGFWIISSGPLVDTVQGLANFDSTFSNATALNQIVKAELVVQSNLGCESRSSKLITVSPFVKADFVQSLDSGCTPLAVNFTNLSSPGSASSWFVDGALVNNSSGQYNYTFVNPGQDVKVFAVKLLVSSVLNAGCMDTLTRFVKVFPRPVAGVLGAVPDNGCSPVNISFFSNALGATRYFYDFNDGSVMDTTLPSISHVFVNNASLTTRNFNVSLQVSNAFGCTDNTNRLVSIKPTVTAIISTNDTLGCTPYSVGFSGLNSINSNMYAWDFGDGTGSALATPVKVYNNNSDTIQRYTIRLITNRTGVNCPDTTTFPIRVYPKPVTEFVPNPLVGCNPLPVSIINLTTGAISGNWTFSGNGNTVTKQAGTSFDTTFVNDQSNLNLNVDISLTSTNALGCSDTKTRTVTIYPAVEAAFVQSVDSGCSPLRVRFTNQSLAGNLVNWYVDGQLVSSLLTNFSYTFENNGLSTRTFEVKMIARAALAQECLDTVVSYVTVFPKPSAGFINAMPEIACSPARIDFVGTAIGANRFIWNFGDGAELDTTVQEVSHVFMNTNSMNNRNFRIRLVAINDQGCRDTSYRNVTVRPLVVAIIVSNDSIGCSPYTASFSASQSTNANQYEWDFGGLGTSSVMNPSFTFTNISDSTECHRVRLITRRTGVECADTAYFTVCVYAKPTAAFNVNPVSGCQPLSVSLLNQSELTTTSVWQFISGGLTTEVTALNYDTVVSNLSAQIKTVWVILNAYSANGCLNKLEKQFTVAPFVKADFTQSVDSGCSPLRVSFVNLSSAGSSAAWFVDGNPVSSSNGSFNFSFLNNSTVIRVAEVMLVVRNNLVSTCMDTIRKKVWIYPKPDAGVISATPESGCSPLFTLLSAQPNLGSRFVWDFRDGTVLDTTALSVSHTFVNFNPSANMPFNVMFVTISDKGCTDTAYKPVVVSPFTVARIGLTDSVGCSPLTLQFAGALSQNANRFVWDFGDGGSGSLVANPVRTFTNNTQQEAIFNVRLVASRNGFSCPDTAYKTIRVYPNPKASFTSSSSGGCGPLNVEFVNNSELADSTVWIISSIAGVDTLINIPATWDTTFSNPFPQQMNVRVELHVWTSKGCYHSTVRNILVNPNVTAAFTTTANGCSPLAVSFNNQSNNPGGAYLWNFGDGSPVSSVFSPSHIFTYNGPSDTTFNVSLLAISNPAFVPNCNKTVTLPVRVYAKPRPDFNMDPEILQLPNRVVTFSNLTPYRPNWKYLWIFGDGTTDTSSALTLSHDYSSLLTELANLNVTVKLVAFNALGCADTIRKVLQIRPIKPVVDFEPDTAGCAPLLVGFRNYSKYGNQYFWTFGDGTSSTEQNPRKRYEAPGQYSVSLRVIGPGGETTLKRDNIITVYEIPDASFTTVPRAPRALRIPEEKMNCFVRYPQPGWTYEWNFGDGSTSREKDPVHQYKNPGSYNISLTVTSAEGCVDSDTLTNGAIVEKGNLVIVPNAFTPRSEGSADGYVDREDGTNDIFYPLTEGVTEIRLQIFNRWGQFLYESTTLNKGWDGTFNGSPCKSDVYVYKVWCRFVDGRTETRVGDLTLLR